jgi:hypothetical protein
VSGVNGAAGAKLAAAGTSVEARIAGDLSQSVQKSSVAWIVVVGLIVVAVGLIGFVVLAR